MHELHSLIEIVSQAHLLLADYQQTTIFSEDVREPAIRGFIIVGAFIIFPVVVAWSFERCSTAYQRHLGAPED